MPDSTSLDSLLGDDESFSSFHDASLLRVTVDYERGTWAGTFEVVVEGPGSAPSDERVRRRRCELELRGLKLWVVEPGLALGGGLWLTADGALSESPTEAGRAFAQRVSSVPFAWFLYFSDTNTFAYLAGQEASCRWL